MLNQEERAAKFFDAITKDAEERHEEMTRKTRETVESGLEKAKTKAHSQAQAKICLLYTSPSPRDRTRSRMPSSA